MVFHPPIYALVVVGGTAAGISIATQAHEAGVASVLLLEECDRVVAPIGAIPFPFEVHCQTSVADITRRDDHFVIDAAELSYLARACVVASVPEGTPNTPGYELPPPFLAGSTAQS
jgi:hypothetical protein